MDEISSGGPRGSIGGREATMGEDMDGGVVDGRHGRSSWEDRRLTRRNMAQPFLKVDLDLNELMQDPDMSGTEGSGSGGEFMDMGVSNRQRVSSAGEFDLNKVCITEMEECVLDVEHQGSDASVPQTSEQPRNSARCTGESIGGSGSCGGAFDGSVDSNCIPVDTSGMNLDDNELS